MPSSLHMQTHMYTYNILVGRNTGIPLIQTHGHTLCTHAKNPRCNTQVHTCTMQAGKYTYDYMQANAYVHIQTCTCYLCVHIDTYEFMHVLTQELICEQGHRHTCRYRHMHRHVHTGGTHRCIHMCTEYTCKAVQHVTHMHLTHAYEQAYTLGSSTLFRKDARRTSLEWGPRDGTECQRANLSHPTIPEPF